MKYSLRNQTFIYCVLTCFFIVITTNKGIAQSDTTSLKKELQSIKEKESVNSFAYAEQLLKLTQTYHQKQQFDYSETHIESVNSILQFFTDSVPPNYEVEYALKEKINAIRIDQLFTAWQYHFLLKEYDVAQYILEEKDWINRSLILKKHELILDFLKQMHQSVGSYDKSYLKNWWTVYTHYITSSHYNLHEAERLWKSLCEERSKKYGNYSQLHLDGLFAYANFCNRTNKTEQADSLKAIVDKHWKTILAKATEENTAHTLVEEMPRFPGCELDTTNLVEKKKCADQTLLKFVYNHIKYPTPAIEDNIEGMAVISFIVSEYGTIYNAEILKNPGGATGEEALRVVMLMNEYPLRWSAGKHEGKKVEVRYNLPVRFRLN